MNALLLLLALSAAPVRAAEPALVFLTGDKEVLRVTAADLRKRPDARAIEIADPLYGKRKRYRAVPIMSLLTSAYGPSWVEDGVGEIFFGAIDGYRTHARAPALTADGGMLAFEDLDAPEWEVIPRHGEEKPGPFYLVWTDPEKTVRKGYPWPWQLISIKPALIEEEYPKAMPAGAAPNSPAARGWAIFRRDCISCHAISGQGGAVGPDLNEPRGITRYLEKKFLKPFIRRPSSFRHTRMPDFGDLTSDDLDDLMAYFDLVSDLAGTK